MRKRISLIVLVGAIAGSPIAGSAAAVCNQDSDLARPISLGSAGSNINMIQTNAQGDVIGCCTGTLGAMVKGPGGKYILSNNHVLARVNLGKNGEGIIQPGCPSSQPADDIVAKLSASSKINFAVKGKNQIDAALAHIVAGDVAATSSISDRSAASRRLQ